MSLRSRIVAYKAIEQSDAAQQFTPARLKVLANSIRGFKLGGAELPADQKPRYAEIQDRQAAITAKFSENVLDATNAFELIVTDKADLAGIPEYAVHAAEELAKSEGKTGYKFTLQFPSYFPVLQYAEKRELRETLYEAYAKRAYLALAGAELNAELEHQTRRDTTSGPEEPMGARGAYVADTLPDET